MTFLTPIPAIIAAAITVPALLVLYFLKLRRRPVRVGSTMLWADAAEDLQANIPFKWIRPSLLLFLQLLILGALLAALARPALRSAGDMPGQVFILIDRSASMRATDMPGGRTRLDAAREQARLVIERTTVGSFAGEITLLGFAGSAEIVAGPTRSRGELLRALESITPTDQPGKLADALRLVQALILPDSGDEASPRPTVVICSDGSAGEDLPALDAPVRFERAAPDEVGTNFGVVTIATQRDSQSPALVRVFARIESTASESTTLGVALDLDGVVVSRQSLTLAPAGGTGAGQTPLAMECEAPGGGLLTLTIEREDVLAADNRVSVVIAPPRQARVLLVRPSESDDAGSGWLLTDVLRELHLGALTLISADRVAQLGADAYRGVDMAIFDAAPSVGIPPVPSLHFGSPPSLPELVSTPGVGGVRPVLSWRRTDPLLRDVSLDAVRIGQTMLLSPAPDAASGAFIELARTTDGVVLARIEHQRVAHVVAGFDLLQSTWPLDAGFPVFLAQAVESMPSGELGRTGWSATTGAAVTLDAHDDGVLRDPDGATHPVQIVADAARLGVLDRVGVWRLGGRPVPVNLCDARESSLEAPRLLPIPGGGAGAGLPGDVSGEPREIWPWCIMAAGLLLVIEWVIFGLRVRI
ncbi:MAG: VWA domain-containing protein [Phycisphaerales bacterium]|nr:VWA domain-containing protein [Phycisphaerales bacterium]